MYVSVSTYTYININMNFSINIYFFNIIILNIKYINTLIFQYIFLFFFCRNFPLSVYIIFLYNFSIHLTSMINKEDNITLNTYLHNVFAFVYVCAPCICTRTSLLVEQYSIKLSNFKELHIDHNDIIYVHLILTNSYAQILRIKWTLSASFVVNQRISSGNSKLNSSRHFTFMHNMYRTVESQEMKSCFPKRSK